MTPISHVCFMGESRLYLSPGIVRDTAPGMTILERGLVRNASRKHIKNKFILVFLTRVCSLTARNMPHHGMEGAKHVSMVEGVTGTLAGEPSKQDLRYTQKSVFLPSLLLLTIVGPIHCGPP